jgi:hypothetical protein
MAITNEVQGIIVMLAYTTKSMPAIIIRYLVSIKDDEILTVLVDNGSFHNKVCIEPVETLEKNHYSGFKAIFVSSSV